METTSAKSAGLPIARHVEGVSIRKLLADPHASWTRPALTTHGFGNHAVRTAEWRYIRYANGDEELYDETKDPYEWTNLAAEAKHADTRKELAKWMPAKSAPPMAGSQSRLLTFADGVPVWEGKPIGKDDPFPEK